MSALTFSDLRESIKNKIESINDFSFTLSLVCLFMATHAVQFYPEVRQLPRFENLKPALDEYAQSVLHYFKPEVDALIRILKTKFVSKFQRAIADGAMLPDGIETAWRSVVDELNKEFLADSKVKIEPLTNRQPGEALIH